MTTETPTSDSRVASLEYLLAGKDFLFFLEHVYIMEPPPGGGKIPFAKWPHLMELAALLTTNRLLVVLKARQLGFSWLMAAYATWLLMYREGSVSMLISRGQKEAEVLLGKAKYIYRNLPDTWQVPLDKDSDSEFSLRDSESKISALPSTPHAGRSETASFVFQDEADFHEFLDANYTAIKPTIDAGGQMVMGSTSDKLKMDSLFKDIYRDSREKQQRGIADSIDAWKPLFFAWQTRPGRTEDWYQRTKADVPGKRLDETRGLSPDLYMLQEYPATEEEALSPPKTRMVFDRDVLDDMALDEKRPVSTKGVVKVYQKWRAGGRYAAATDTSHGVGGDFAVTVIIDASTGMVVADIMSDTLSPEDLSWQSMELLKEYRKPIWAIEDNEWGIITIQAAQREKYPRLYHRVTGRKTRLVGWHTDEVSRFRLFGELIAAVHARQIIVPNPAGLAQFYTIVRNPKKGSRVEAVGGAHDDYVLTVGMAWQMRDLAYASPPLADMPQLFREAPVPVVRW